MIEELNMYLDTPTSYVSELFEDLLYKDQPAGWRIVGEKQNILDYTREKVVDYYKTHYSNQNTLHLKSSSSTRIRSEAFRGTKLFSVFTKTGRDRIKFLLVTLSGAKQKSLIIFCSVSGWQNIRTL